MDLFDIPSLTPSESADFADFTAVAEDSMGPLQPPNATCDAEKPLRKLRRSCELCRNTKGRCIPSKTDSRCQRCLRDGKECIFLQTKPRPKRAKNSRTRVAEMEEKLEGLVALLTSTTKATKETAIPSPPEEPASIMVTATATARSNANRTDSFSFPFSSPPVRPEKEPLPAHLQHYSVFPFPDCTFKFDDLNDPISRGIVSFEQGEDFVRNFKTKAYKFPFVLVPPDMSLDTLRRERPFFLLSILTYSSQSKAKLQSQLEHELKESLSKRVIMNGEKTLDLLQGLLIYLAWHHLFYDPDNQQVYQLTQMAVSMTVDLGINKPPRDFLPLSLQSLKGHPFSILPPICTPEELETRRTYLGCCYLASATCMGLRKPCQVKYNEYTDACSKALTDTSEYESDQLIPYYLRLQKLLQDVNEAFDYGQLQQLPELDAVRIEILLKAFNEQLSQCEKDFPPHIWDNSAISSTYFCLRIYINEIGFHATPPVSASPNMNHPQNAPTIVSRRSWYYAVSRNTTIARCLAAAQSYLDHFLSLSGPDLDDALMPEYIHFIYAVLVLGAFSSPVDVPTLDQVSIREQARISYYIDALINRTGEMKAEREEGSNEYMGHIHMLLKQSKIWFSKQGPGGFNAGTCFVKNAELEFMDILPTIMNRCVEYCVDNQINKVWNGKNGSDKGGGNNSVGCGDVLGGGGGGNLNDGIAGGMGDGLVPGNWADIDILQNWSELGQGMAVDTSIVGSME
ncbi:hypothetical protein BGZ60DRAFT_398964 [Tricladium varicosporioides]|nr:hypothetical protein BGZ60DRAFT_398964 [Hymenoscyphus varicosporioides]